MRVSTRNQTTASQKADLERYVNAREETDNVKWYEDTATGKNMEIGRASCRERV